MIIFFFRENSKYFNYYTKYGWLKEWKDKISMFKRIEVSVKSGKKCMISFKETLGKKKLYVTCSVRKNVLLLGNIVACSYEWKKNCVANNEKKVYDINNGC